VGVVERWEEVSRCTILGGSCGNSLPGFAGCVRELIGQVCMYKGTKDVGEKGEEFSQGTCIELVPESEPRLMRGLEEDREGGDTGGHFVLVRLSPSIFFLASLSFTKKAGKKMKMLQLGIVCVCWQF